MTCGSNCKGQLGLGHTQDCSSLQRVDALSKQKIVKVSGGWDFTVACTGEYYKRNVHLFLILTEVVVITLV